MQTTNYSKFNTIYGKGKLKKIDKNIVSNMEKTKNSMFI